MPKIIASGGTISFEELQNGRNGMLMKLGRFMSLYDIFLLR